MKFNFNLIFGKVCSFVGAILVGLCITGIDAWGVSCWTIGGIAIGVLLATLAETFLYSIFKETKH